MQDIINFTSCKQFGGKIRFSEDNGIRRLMLKVKYGDSYYNLKFGPRYFYHCISEYLGCSIFNALGVPAQKVLFGVYEFKKKELPVVVCRWVDDKSLYFLSMADIIKEEYNTDFGQNILNEIYALGQQCFYNANELKKHFWKMFIIDAFIGTVDRSESDWGVLVDRKSQKVVSIAPVFNCSTCLLAEQLDNDSMCRKIFFEQENNDSLFSLDITKYEINGNQLSYFKFLSETQDRDCLNALVEMATKISVLNTDEIVDSVKFISELEKKSYKKFLAMRKKILTEKANRVNDSIRN